MLEGLGFALAPSYPNVCDEATRLTGTLFVILFITYIFSITVLPIVAVKVKVSASLVQLAPLAV